MTQPDENTPVVDLTSFREFTDGDPETEKMLLDIFVNKSKENLATMNAYCLDGPREEWRCAAHSLKGSSANLGAGALHQLSLKAEQLYEASLPEKQEILHNVEQEFTKVCTFLQTL